MFGPLVRRAIENVHFTTNIENSVIFGDVNCAWKHEHTLTNAVKTIFVKRLQFGFNSHRMDHRPDDFAREFNVPPGHPPLKETTRRKY